MPGCSPSPKSRKRSHHAKVRSGCTVCKARRIKCDETRPACARCQVGGRKCVYTLLPKAWIFESSKELCIPERPRDIVCAVHSERRAFDFFRENTAATFAGQHELAGRFWKYFIPQAATSESLIFKLAVALGSQHEAVSHGSIQADALATTTYTTVIGTLAKRLPKLNVGITLLCCGLLMANANLCEDGPSAAAVHFSLGLQVLRESTSPYIPAVSDAMCTFIEPMFAELELVAAMFIAPLKNVELIGAQPPPRPSVASTFSDLFAAKQTLTDIFRWSLYVCVGFRHRPTELAIKILEVDNFILRWKQAVIRYSLTVADKSPQLLAQARKMLFQYKMFATCRTAARSPIFLKACQVQILSIDLSQPHLLSVICRLKNEIKDTWRPLARKPTGDADDLDIWPRGEPLGHDGADQIVRISVGSSRDGET